MDKNKNFNDKFLNELGKKFFKDQKKDQGDTVAVVLNQLEHDVNKNLKNIKDFGACFICKDGTNYFVSTKGSVAELIGFLTFFRARAISDYTHSSDDSND